MLSPLVRTLLPLVIEVAQHRTRSLQALVRQPSAPQLRHQVIVLLLVVIKQQQPVIMLTQKVIILEL
jgi:hypothetical protein